MRTFFNTFAVTNDITMTILRANFAHIFIYFHVNNIYIPENKTSRLREFVLFKVFDATCPIPLYKGKELQFHSKL